MFATHIVRSCIRILILFGHVYTMNRKINLKQIFQWSQESQLLTKLREFGAIPNEGDVKCPSCGESMHLWFSEANNEWYWRCNRKIRVPHKKKTSCNNKHSVKKFSIFEGIWHTNKSWSSFTSGQITLKFRKCHLKPILHHQTQPQIGINFALKLWLIHVLQTQLRSVSVQS